MPALLHKHRNILDFALSSLVRRKARALALLGVYALVVAVLASLVFFVQALKRDAGVLLEGAPDMVVQRLVAGRHDLIPMAWAQDVAALPGVRRAAPRRWGYHYDPATGANFTVLAQAPGTVPEGAAILGAGVARVLQVQRGHLITLQTCRRQPLLLSVQDILPPASELATADLVLVPPDTFQALFELPEGQATDLVVEVANPRELETLAAKVAAAFPGARPILKREILRTYEAIFDWRGGMVTVAGLMAVLAFLILAWDRASGLSAEERREIGILKSVGWDTADVLALKVWEGCAVSLTAFLAGVLLGYAHVFLFSGKLFEPALRGWSVLYPSHRLLPHVDPFQLAVLFFLTVVPYTLATVVPSWRAASADPDAALRS